MFQDKRGRRPPPLTRGGPNTISPRGGTAGGATSHVQPHTANLKRIPTVLVDPDPGKQSADGTTIMTGLLLWGSSHEDGFSGTLKRGKLGRWMKFHCYKGIVIVYLPPETN